MKKYRIIAAVTLIVTLLYGVFGALKLFGKGEAFLTALTLYVVPILWAMVLIMLVVQKIATRDVHVVSIPSIAMTAVYAVAYVLAGGFGNAQMYLLLCICFVLQLIFLILNFFNQLRAYENARDGKPIDDYKTVTEETYRERAEKRAKKGKKS